MGKMPAALSKPAWVSSHRQNISNARGTVKTALCAGLCMVLLLALCAQKASAQNQNIILEVRVEGASPVERGQILSGLQSRVDEPLNLKNITSDVKAIFKLGLFENITAEVEEVGGKGSILIFRVVEKPRISMVRIIGNTTINEDTLAESLKVKVGNPYSRRLVEKNLQIVREEFRKKGYLKVKVRSQIDRLSKTAYAFNIIIQETPRLYITKIRTHNNAVFSELEIKRFMRSAEVDCFSWMTDSGIFDEEKINQDLQGLTAQYLTKGYIRLLIHKPKVKLVHNPEFSRIIVDLHFEEGDQYFTRSVDIAGGILGKKADLMDLLELKKGEVYDPFKQNRDRFRLNQIYEEQGYAFMQVVPDVKIDDNQKRVDVVYRIKKGEKAYIGRIEFQGNRETRDYVIRREFQVRENELYNGLGLRTSQQNLQRLGFFSPGMRLDKVPGEADNVLDIVTKMEETQTGTFQTQIGYSDTSGLLVSASLSKGNLFGRGQTARFSATYGERNVTREFSADFIEPHLFGSDFSSDSSISFSTKDDISELSSGDIEQEYFSQGFGYPIIPLLRFNINFAVTNRFFSLPVEEPTKFRSVTSSLLWNSVNNPIFPSSGTNATFSFQQVGGKILGGETEYRRYRLQTRKFIALNTSNTLVLMGRMRLGLLEAINDNLIPLQDRFRIGGISTLRGYSYAEVGGPFGNLARSLNTISVQGFDQSGQPLFDSEGNAVTVSVDQRILGLNQDVLRKLRSGGISERLFTLEMLFPLAGDNVRGVVFYDAGNVNAEPEQYEILKEAEPGFFDLKQTYGVGVRLITPLGVFRFEYGKKIAPEPDESGDKFDFTISSLF